MPCVQLEKRDVSNLKCAQLVLTHSYLLTFNKPQVPSRLKVGYLSLPVRTYYPPPMRCFRCQRFGHVALKCENDNICVCGKTQHHGFPCGGNPVCVNCGDSHHARSRDCKVYKQEIAIQKLKTDEKLTYIEAKRIVKSRSPSLSNISYAQVAGKDTTNKSDIDIKTIVQAIAPEITRIILEKLESTENFRSTAKARKAPSYSLQNAVPTSVLRNAVKEVRHERGTLDFEFSDQIKKPLKKSTQKTRKRSKDETSTAISSAASVVEESIKLVDSGGSSSQEKPPKKRQSIKSTKAKTNNKIENFTETSTDHEESAEESRDSMEL